jgi:hypothetical protein
MKEQSWDREYAQNAMNEYLKFMFLCKFAGHGVTPSEVVDEVWHLHLIYSESYWEQLCGKVLNKTVHHTPGTGDDGDKYEIQYRKTIQSYKTAFGVPNLTVWPTPKAEKLDVGKVVEKKKSLYERMFGKKEEPRYAESSRVSDTPSSSPIVSTCGAADTGGHSGGSSHCSGGGGSHCSSGGGSSCSSGGGSSCGSSCGSGCGGGCGG